MMTPLARLLSTALFVLLGVVACDRDRGEKQVPAADREPTKSETAEAEPIGPQRIVSLAPSVTETLYALGAGDRVVGVTRFCDTPPEATEKPKVGGLTDTDVETIVSLEPDLVVGVQTQTASSLRRTLEKADVPTLFIPVETFDDVRRGILELGERVDNEERATELADAITAVDRSTADDAPYVLVLFGRDPWIGAGPDTFADEMIRRAGGRNALADAERAYVTLDAERLQATRADLILDTSTGGPNADAPPPIADARLVRIDPGLMRPGPRLAEAMRSFVTAIDETKKTQKSREPR